GELAVELGLLGEQPARDAADLRRRRAGRRAEGARLGERRIERAGHCEDRERGGHGGRRTDQDVCRLAPPGQGFHGHVTGILLENCSPKLLPGARLWKKASPSRDCVCVRASRGRAMASLQAAGALTRWTGSFSAKEKSTNQLGS